MLQSENYRSNFDADKSAHSNMIALVKIFHIFLLMSTALCKMGKDYDIQINKENFIESISTTKVSRTLLTKACVCNHLVIPCLTVQETMLNLIKNSNISQKNVINLLTNENSVISTNPIKRLCGHCNSPACQNSLLKTRTLLKELSFKCILWVISVRYIEDIFPEKRNLHFLEPLRLGDKQSFTNDEVILSCIFYNQEGCCFADFELSYHTQSPRFFIKILKHIKTSKLSFTKSLQLFSYGSPKNSDKMSLCYWKLIKYVMKYYSALERENHAIYVHNDEIGKKNKLLKYLQKRSLPSTRKLWRKLLWESNIENTSENSTEIPPNVDHQNSSGKEVNFANRNSKKEFSLEGINPFQRRGDEDVIYIHGLFEMSGEDCRDYPHTGPYEYKAAQLAIQHINQKDIVQGYKLQMYYNDTKCDSGVAVDAFFHSLYRQPTMSVLLGTGSSEVTERLARVVSRWNVIQMSYGASSPALSDRKNFPMFFRTVAPDSSHNAAIVAFILNHKWSHVAAFHEQGDRHALPMTKLINDLEEVNVTVTLTKGASEKDYKDHLQEMKDQDCRIILCSFSAILFKKVFCQIYKLGMHVGEYVWILLGDAAELWWRESSDIVCNRRRIANDIRSVVTVSSHYELRENGSAISMITMLDVLADIGYSVPQSTGYVPHTYDAVWAIALALNHVEQMWRTTNASITLGDFTYNKGFMAQQLSNAVENLHFMGVSGPVSFHKSDRVGITAFHQKQDNLLKLAAVYDPEAAELDDHCLGCSGFLWQGGNPPISSRVIIRRIAVLDRRVFICVTALAVLGVLLALIFLSFNLYYRKVKFIKLSSPNLNNFVVVGCVLVYIAVILLGMDHGTLASDDHFPIICSARAVLLSGGFSLAFGCMFIKTYRVYYIFIRANTGIVKSKLLHDQQLLGMVSVLLLVDCILVTLWVTIDPMERQLTDLSMQVNKNERNVVYLYLREHCYSPHMAKWLGSLYIYKGLLLVVGCYMAWETRHVKVPALNDSQYIGMSVYNVVITSIIVVALANIIPADRYTLTFVLVSTLIFVSTTTTLCILFVPKMHTILMDPDGTTIIATPGVKVECKTRRFAMDEPRESVYRAEVLNRALKRELLELDEEYNKLATKLGLSPCAVREPKLNSDIQDDDSDDGLPPWLADYKDFSSPRNDIWYTNRPTIASAFSTIHNVALQIPSTSNFQVDINTNKKHAASGGKPTKQAASGNFLSTSNSSKISLTAIKPVRTFLSDRALNKLKTLQTLHESAFDDIDGSPKHIRNLAHSDKRLSSEPKLYSKLVSQDICFVKFPTGSLNQVSASVIEGSFSDHSKNTTSITSDWTTAPLYESTSFSTPPEDFFSSSNNGNDSRRDVKPISNHIYTSCKEYDASNSIVDSDNQNNKDLSGSETSENGGFSNDQSNTNAETSNNSISEATISDLSSDMKCKLDMEPGKTRLNSTAPNATMRNSPNPDVPQENPTQDSVFSERNANLIQFHFDSLSNVERSSSETCAVSISEESTHVLVDNFEQLTTETIENCAKSDETQSSDIENNQISQCWNSPAAETESPLCNNLEEQPRTMQIDNLRNQIFRLERELIFLQLDQSESVDL